MQPDTLALVVHAPKRPEFLGLEVIITGSVITGGRQPAMCYLGRTRDGRLCYGTRRCFLPLEPHVPAGLQRITNIGTQE